MEPSAAQKELPNEIWEKIFSCLRDADNQTLVACRETSSKFRYWVDKKTSYLARIPLGDVVEANHVESFRLLLETN